MKDNWSQVKGQNPDPNKIKCKDCIFRDKTVIDLGYKLINVGVTRITCKKFIGKPNGKNKPSEVLFLNEDCNLYQKDV